MNPVRDALYDRLAATAALTALLSDSAALFHRVAPPEARTPFVVFTKQTGTPTWAFDGPPLRNDVWLVKAIDRSGSASLAEDIDAQIDMALTDAPLAITGRTLLYLRRESDVDYPEQDGAETFHHVGGLYRLITVPS